MKKQVEFKVSQGLYRLELTRCCICNSNDFETLSEKDRYGLYMPVVICRQCGLIQTNPRMNRESYASFYKHEYRKLYGGEESPSDEFFREQYYRGHKIFSYLQHVGVVQAPPELFVLEVGCGAGGILQYFREKGCRVQGVDLGADYLMFGRTRHDLDLRVGTIAVVAGKIMPNIIIYSHVFEHVLAPNEELAHVDRLLDDGGVVYIECPGVKNLSNDYEMDFLRFLQNAHTYHFTLTTLACLLTLWQLGDRQQLLGPVCQAISAVQRVLALENFPC